MRIEGEVSMAAPVDYKDWLPKSSSATRNAELRPRNYWNFNKERPFDFRSCDYCYDRAAFVCKHCNVYYCAAEECKEFHEGSHVLVRLGGGRD